MDILKKLKNLRYMYVYIYVYFFIHILFIVYFFIIQLYNIKILIKNFNLYGH